MITALGAPEIQSTPADVKEYLQRSGWHESYAASRPLWTMAGNYGAFFTWEQALAYTMWSRLHKLQSP